MKQRAAFILYLLAAVTYTHDIKPILDAHCIECHSKGAKLDLSHFPFSSKESLDQETIAKKILAKIQASPPLMPPGNRPKLTEEQVGLIQQWYDDGLAQ